MELRAFVGLHVHIRSSRFVLVYIKRIFASYIYIHTHIAFVCIFSKGFFYISFVVVYISFGHAGVLTFLLLCLCYFWTVYLPAHLYLCLAARLSLCLFLCLPLCLCLSLCLSVCLSVSVCLSLCLCLFLSVSQSLSVCLSLSLSNCSLVGNLSRINSVAEDGEVDQSLLFTDLTQ